MGDDDYDDYDECVIFFWGGEALLLWFVFVCFRGSGVRDHGGSWSGVDPIMVAVYKVGT